MPVPTNWAEAPEFVPCIKEVLCVQEVVAHFYIVSYNIKWSTVCPRSSNPFHIVGYYI